MPTCTIYSIYIGVNTETTLSHPKIGIPNNACKAGLYLINVGCVFLVRHAKEACWCHFQLLFWQ